MTGSVLSNPQRLSAALALLRGVAGFVFIAHGAQKLFVFGIAGTTAAFGGMGVPLPEVAGPGVAFLELFGGLALLLGLGTRVVATLLGGVMLGAIAMVHLSAGFFAPNGIEFPLLLLAASAALLITGPGVFSLDHLLATLRQGADEQAGVNAEVTPVRRHAA